MFERVLMLNVYKHASEIPVQVHLAILEYRDMHANEYLFEFSTHWYDGDELTDDEDDCIRTIRDFLLSHNVTKCYIST